MSRFLKVHKSNKYRMNGTKMFLAIPFVLGALAYNNLQKKAYIKEISGRPPRYPYISPKIVFSYPAPQNPFVAMKTEHVSWLGIPKQRMILPNGSKVTLYGNDNDERFQRIGHVMT